VLDLLLKAVVNALLPFRFQHKKDIRGQKVLITGAGNGIGKALAERFAQLGHVTLVLWDIDEENLVETAKICRRYLIETNEKVTTYTVNLGNRAEIYQVSKQVLNEVGKVDILINNAGILNGGPFMQVTDERLELIVDVNMMSHLWTVKAFLPSMLIVNSGHIVCTASVAGFIGAPCLVDYSTTKFAVLGFMEALNNELAMLGKDGIKTTTVCPAFVRTQMVNSLKLNEKVPILTTEFVAELILQAILTEQQLIVIPNKIYLHYIIKGLIPVCLYQRLITKLPVD